MRRLKKLEGRPGKVADERWACPASVEERRNGGLGPFRHEGMVWDVSYVLRSAENQKKISEEKAVVAVKTGELEAINVAREKDGKSPMRLSGVPDWRSSRPGDCVVSRDFRTVYFIHVDGSRRRVEEHEAKSKAIQMVKDQLELLKKK